MSAYQYNFNGLSPQSFERMVQALCAKVIAPGIQVFGSGPDGGREASFRGKMNYPSITDPWDGYLIVQAKFKERPGDADEDGRWVKEQLEKELDEFDRSSNRTKPHYYLLVTNAVLSPVGGKGWKDKLDALLSKRSQEERDRAARLSYERKEHVEPFFKNAHIWGRDELVAHLDTHRDIARRNAAFILTGDVLALIYEHFQSKNRNFDQIMRRFLTRELRNDQYADLDQARNTAERNTRLAQVFIDVPAASERLEDPPEGEFRSIMRQFFEEGKQQLNPAGFDDAGLKGRSRTGRLVLVGGPGQGKTTVGKFLCQLHRAALLLPVRERLAPEDLGILEGIEQLCKEEQVGLPLARRFPVWISLAEFAKSLADKSTTSMLQFIQRRIAERSDTEIDRGDLRAWLREYPWLLVLDGLDEVPAASNRASVMEGVHGFMSEIAECGGDVMVVATTRPQGYSDEFSPSHYAHVWLAPLSTKQSLRYATRLANAKHGDNSDRSKKILEQLEKAAVQPATARLMRSPLQTTIMFTLVEQGGTPPEQRWKLFEEYYETIYRRESNKPTDDAALLRTYKSDIDEVHRRVGLHLQIRSERTGGTDASMTGAELQGVVRQRLQEEGHKEAELDRIGQQLVSAASNRLVFLVVRSTTLSNNTTVHHHGFEIRSLQEFMAAWALLQGSDKEKQSRLEQIATSAYWRNVFLFAAGACYSKHEHLRDFLDTLCRDLNERDPFSFLRTGSVLATEILLDGLLLQMPKYARLMAKTVLEIVSAESTSFVDRAFLAVRHLEAGDLESRLRPLTTEPPEKHPNAWRLAATFAGKQHEWACEMLRQRCRESPENHLSFCLAASEWFSERSRPMRGAVPDPSIYEVEIAAACKIINTWRSEDKFVYLPPGFGGWIRKSDSYSRIPLAGFGGKDHSLCVLTLKQARVLYQSLQFEAHNNEWDFVNRCIDFAVAPTCAALEKTLRAAAERDEFPGLRPLVWPLAALMHSCSSKDEFQQAALRLADGDLGTPADWHAAEARWERDGARPEDFDHASNVGGLWDRQISRVGFPLGASFGSSVTLLQDKSGPDRFARLDRSFRSASSRVSKLPNGVVRCILDDATSSSRWAERGSLAAHAQTIQQLLRRHHWMNHADLALLAWQCSSSDPEFFDRLDDFGAVSTWQCKKQERGIEHIEISQLCHQFVLKNRQSLGALTFTAKYAQDRCMPFFEAPVSRLKSQERNERVSAILQCLATLRNDSRLACDLAERTLDLAALESGLIAAAVRVAEQTPNAAQLTYFKELLGNLSDYRLRHDAATGLANAVQRRTSGLEEPSTQRKLGLEFLSAGI